MCTDAMEAGEAKLGDDLPWKVECLDAFMHRSGFSTQERLAAATGVEQQKISNVNQGKYYLTPDLARALAPALEVSSSDLRLACVLWRFRRQLDADRLTAHDEKTFLSVIRLAVTQDQKCAVWETHHQWYLYLTKKWLDNVRHLFSASLVP